MKASPTTDAKRRIRLGHSPDPDDAFMFYGLSSGHVDSGAFDVVHELVDIQTLNERATRGEMEITAISFHAYAHVADRYALLPHGASFGDGYGPLLVSRAPLASVKGRTVAIPGMLTSAWLALRLFEPDVRPIVVPFDRIPKAVQDGDADVGLLIHEGQLTYAAQGLHRIADLGAWWKETTGLPLPLGGNAIRKDLGPDAHRQLSRILRESITYGLAHRDEALEHAMRWGRGLERGLTDRFVGMYVNDWTLDYGEVGRRAIETFLGRAADRGFIPRVSKIEFV
ncbi:MAG: ABC transporter substrate-binding protein [Planctomycetes bacterium]|nr:ABC transporter substrate-binding protein [Planctomycetota bacterium]MBI3845788.1 ABC transporter substrate-binding protein [Planctomycetota bacterium]